MEKMIMATFGSWLNEQVSRDDATGMVARIWKDAEGDRPRASAPSTIQRWMEAQFPDNKAQISEAFTRVMTEWRSLKDDRHLQAVAEGATGPRTVQLPPVFEDEIRMRLAAIEVNLQLIAAKLGCELVEETLVRAEAAGLTSTNWSALAELADYAAADEAIDG